MSAVGPRARNESLGAADGPAARTPASAPTATGGEHHSGDDHPALIQMILK